MERLFARGYRRLGAWYLAAYCAVLLLYLYGLLALVIAMAGRSRNADAETVIAVFAGGAGVGTVGVGVLLWAVRSDLAAILRWMRGERTAETAATTWSALLALPAHAWRGTLVILPVITVVYSPIFGAALDLSVASAATFGGIILLLAAGPGGIMGLLLIEVGTRPIVREVLALIPGPAPDLPPPLFSLDRRLLIATPLVGLTVAVTALALAEPDASPGTLAGHMLIALGITVVVGGVMAGLLALSVLGPVNELVRATERMRAGDLDTPATVLSSDELGHLTEDFNDALTEVRESRARIVAAGDAARRKVERDLHDGAQQRLVMLRLQLGVAQRQLEAGDPRTADSLTAARDDLGAALAELRELAHGVYPALLESDGIAAALSDAAARSPLPTTVDSDGAGRYAPAIEAAVYFTCLEALQNAAKHAGAAAHVRVALAEEPGVLAFDVSDDGAGCATPPSGDGVQNMRDRIGALGGTLQVRSAPGAGTAVRGRMPIR